MMDGVLNPAIILSENCHKTRTSVLAASSEHMMLVDLMQQFFRLAVALTLDIKICCLIKNHVYQWFKKTNTDKFN